MTHEILKQFKADKKAKWIEIASQVFEGAAPLATALMMFKKNRPTDWLGLGIAGLNAFLSGKKIYNELSSDSEILYRRGEDGRSLFVALPLALRPLAIDILNQHESWVASQVDGLGGAEDPVKVHLLHGHLFVSCANSGNTTFTEKRSIGDVPAILMLRERAEESLEALRNECWSLFDNPNLRISSTGIQHEDESVPENLLVTSRMHDVLTHINKFVDMDIMRSYLFEGPPGTGKTTLIQYLIRETGFRTLRLDISHFEGTFSRRMIDDLQSLIEFTKPDMVILDDIDLLGTHASKQLLSTIEWCRSQIKVFVASANNRQRMTPALLRAGRFDDFFEVNELDPEVVKTILGPDLQDRYEDFKTWPIVYLMDLRKKIKVLGKEEALKSVQHTHKRIAEIHNRILKEWKPAGVEIYEEGDDLD